LVTNLASKLLTLNDMFTEFALKNKNRGWVITFFFHRRYRETLFM